MGKIDRKQYGKNTNITKRGRSKNYSVRGGGYLNLPPLSSIPDTLLLMADNYIEHKSYRKVAKFRYIVNINGRDEQVFYGVTAIRNNLIKLSNTKDEQGEYVYQELRDAMDSNSNWKKGLRKDVKKRYKKMPFYREHLRPWILIQHFVEKVYHISKEDLDIFSHFVDCEFTQKEYMDICRLFQPHRRDLFNQHRNQKLIQIVNREQNKALTKYRLYGRSVTAVNTAHNIMIGKKRLKTSRVDYLNNKIEFDPEIGELFNKYNIYTRQLKGE